MKLNIDDDRTINAPGPDAVRAAVEALAHEEFLVLSAEEERYIQVYRQDDGDYQLEYRDGAPERHFGLEPEGVSTRDVVDAFLLFLAGAPDLADRWAWEPLELIVAPDDDADAEDDEDDDDDDDDEDDGPQVEHNGVMVAEGWPEVIEAAQIMATITIEGTPYERIAYGRERGWPMAAERPCGDCAVGVGQFHVPGCDIEECPRCHGQLITCDCEVEDDDDESDSDDATGLV